jgi:hypothetical protein
MSNKFFKVIFAAVLSIGLVGQANAVPILSEPYFVIGENYTDADGKLWEYIDFFDLDFHGFDARDESGFLTPQLYNGLEAALEFLGVGGDSLQDYALSAFDIDTNQSKKITSAEIGYIAGLDPDHADVNHMAWYDTFGGSVGLTILGESVTTNLGGDTPNRTNNYDADGDISAFVNDRAVLNYNLNYVFKAVEVPEPSTLAIFALALCGLGVRCFKKS